MTHAADKGADPMPSTSATPASDQVGIILVTHKDYGSALLSAAEMIVGQVHDCTCINIDSAVEVDEALHRLQEAADLLSRGRGVLVLTDMFGGTPTNLSLSLMGSRKGADDVEVLTGVNLPMLLRVLQNRTLPMAELAEKALASGCEGIISAGKVLRSKNSDNK